LQDESFTTADAHERLIQGGVSRARRAELVDKMAAAAILQAALDRINK
jgi:putative Holliday junction resolvase